MKKIIFLIMAMAMLAGCADVDNSYNEKMPLGYYVLVIDGCEYIRSGNSLAHKGNCKYCDERRNKKQEELLLKIKGE